jgi:hypothetical protein
MGGPMSISTTHGLHAPDRVLQARGAASTEAGPVPNPLKATLDVSGVWLHRKIGRFGPR